jgi:RNA polymerase sigma-70 factor (ECF subfamily)
MATKFFCFFFVLGVIFHPLYAIIVCKRTRKDLLTAKEYNNGVGLWADDAMRFVVRCGGSRPDCEDAVQEALVALWSHRDEVPCDKGKSFLLSAAYRSLMQTLRHARVIQQHAEEVQTWATAYAQPDEGFDLREAIERSLQGLPEVQRAILQLRDVEGFSYAEIGETLALSDSQVQVYLFRARVAMRKQLKTMGYDNNR